MRWPALPWAVLAQPVLEGGSVQVQTDGWLGVRCGGLCSV